VRDRADLAALTFSPQIENTPKTRTTRRRERERERERDLSKQNIKIGKRVIVSLCVCV